MKRYRTTNIEFDTRANMLTFQIKNEWADSVKAQHKANKEQIRAGLRKTFGEAFYEEKEKNFVDMGSYFPSIISFHNKFFSQIRIAYTMGAYYPALTGVTTLTERVLNHLIIALREDFKSTPEYKDVYNNDSFTDWDKMLKVLESWNILLPETRAHLLKLKKLRHQYAAHFNADTDIRDRDLALGSIHVFQEFIKLQFGFFGKQPWFIPGTKGAFFIKKEFESNPFIRRIYIPNCVYVGPYYEFVDAAGGLQVKDEKYENKEISDDEFKRLLEEKRDK